MKKLFILFFTLILINNEGFGQDSGFTGYATGTVDGDRLTWNTYGLKDVEKGLPYDSLTIQPVGSVSKIIIGLAIMKAVEMDLVELDTDINQYLDFEVTNPNINKGNPITLRHLATHTSGILDNEKFYIQAYQEGNESSLSLSDFLSSYFKKDGSRYSKQNFSKTSSGEAYSYSNMGASLAAYVIERVSKTPFHQFTKEQIFQPLGLKQTHWIYDSSHADQYAQLYDEQDKQLKTYSLVTYPEGGLRTNIIELSKILQFLISGYSGNGSILGADAWKVLFKENFKENPLVKGINPKEPDTGIFIVYAKSGSIGHTGSDPGLCSFLFFDPKTLKGKVFMANEDVTPQNLEAFKAIWDNL